jgi:hypothetical protein
VLGLVVAVAVALGCVLGAAIVCRRPLAVATAAGLLGGPAFYAWLGGHVARSRGEGRFWSFPFGGYRLGDGEMALSVATWAAATGLLAWAIARIATRRGRR